MLVGEHDREIRAAAHPRSELRAKRERNDNKELQAWTRTPHRIPWGRVI
jgi:hypothetical protein